MIVRKHADTILLGIAALIATASIEWAMGRPPSCRCGHIALWHGTIDAGTSQHILDWYSPSHLIHGLIFCGLGAWLLPRLAVSHRFLLALLIECGWELLENSPIVIDRYRTVTAALGYDGDSVLNSLSDIGCMAAGFVIARMLPAWGSWLLAIALELLTLVVIRDNLTLNIVMLLWPVAAIRHWQGAL